MRSLIRSIVREAWTDRPYGIAYTAVVVEQADGIHRLSDAAQEEMLARSGSSDPSEVMQGWKVPADYHMTICLGELPLRMRMRGDIGSEVILHVTHFGMNDEAIAFKVTGYMSKNDVQHITMFFRTEPSASKSITDWSPLRQPFSINGVIRESPAKKP